MITAEDFQYFCNVLGASSQAQEGKNHTEKSAVQSDLGVHVFKCGAYKTGIYTSIRFQASRAARDYNNICSRVFQLSRTGVPIEFPFEELQLCNR